MVDYAVGKVWKAVNLPLLWLVDCKNGILRSLEFFRLQNLMQPLEVAFPVAVEYLNAALPCLAFPRLRVCKLQVVEADYFII